MSTSIASFVGMARRGRLDTPTRVTGRTEYERLFGSDAAMGELTPQVLQFFLNGGNIVWITRIADGAHAAAVTLANEAGQAVLTLTARDAGEDGNLLRAEVDYGTASPETTFNLTVYRHIVGPTGAVTRDGLERFAELSMDPSAGRYVETIVKSGSALVTVDAASAASTVGTDGVSISGLVFPSPMPMPLRLSRFASATIRRRRAACALRSTVSRRSR